MAWRKATDPDHATRPQNETLIGRGIGLDIGLGSTRGEMRVTLWGNPAGPRWLPTVQRDSDLAGGFCEL